jgi:hypothetical protein
VRIGLGRGEAASRAEELVRRGLEFERPAFPGLADGAVRRWRGMASWQPPETAFLSRHRAKDRPHWIVTNRREPPDGYALDYDIGLVQLHEQPGTRQLVERDGTYRLTDSSAPVEPGARGLGHIEQAAFPMMLALELRRVDETGQVVPVAGPDDPLHAVSQPVDHLGFIEGFPIEPRRLIMPALPPWQLALLARRRHAERWRHTYDAVDAAADLDGDALPLGSLWTRPGPGLIQLWRDADGTLTSDIHVRWAEKPGRAPANAGKWVAAPLGWSRRPSGWAVRAAVSRARRLAETRGPNTAEEGRALGYLRAEATPNCSPLFSTIHPVLPDQYVTRSTLEALDMGYHVEGVLGWIADVGAARGPGPSEVLWGSRFGKRRRYVEG